METQKTVPENPTCYCALLCDDVHISRRTNKHVLHGIIGVIFVKELPAIIGGYVSYIRVSNVYPPQTIRISLERGEEEILFSGNATLQGAADDPLGVYTVMEPVPLFAVKEAGRYMFIIRANDGTIIAQTPIMILGTAENSEDE